MLTRSSASKKWRSRLDPNKIRYRALDQTSTANARNIAVRYKGE